MWITSQITKTKMHNCFGCVLFIECSWMCVFFYSSFVCLYVYAYDLKSKVHCASVLSELKTSSCYRYLLRLVVHVACLWMCVFLYFFFICSSAYAYVFKSKVDCGSAVRFGRALLGFPINAHHLSENPNLSLRLRSRLELWSRSWYGWFLEQCFLVRNLLYHDTFVDVIFRGWDWAT